MPTTLKPFWYFFKQYILNMIPINFHYQKGFTMPEQIETNTAHDNNYDEYFESVLSEQKLIAAEHDITQAQAADVQYLRTRGRHTPQLEQLLVATIKQGLPYNIMEFGVTKESQQALVDAATEAYLSTFNKQGN